MSEEKKLPWVEPKSLLQEGEHLPKVSIIIPCQNCATTIGFTLDSLLMQRYTFFEILLIDASSKDRTIEIVKSYRTPLIRIYVVESYNRPEMLNKGISLSQGVYLNFLFPGDYYLTNTALLTIMEIAAVKNMPSLIFSGCLVRDEKADVKLLFRPLTLELLKAGKQPTNLQSCWFKNTIFREIGKFNSAYDERGGFDLFCRILLSKRFEIISIKKFFADYNRQIVTRQVVIRHFWETLNILYFYFGFKTVLKWFFLQKDLKRYLKLWMRSFKTAFVGIRSQERT